MDRKIGKENMHVHQAFPQNRVIVQCSSQVRRMGAYSGRALSPHWVYKCHLKSKVNHVIKPAKHGVIQVSS